MQVGSKAHDLTAERRCPGQAQMAPIEESPSACLQETPMFELNFSSNADWIVALLLAVTVVAALV